jgi:hypothetical protein
LRGRGNLKAALDLHVILKGDENKTTNPQISQMARI